jgi:hypothetical protein
MTGGILTVVFSKNNLRENKGVGRIKCSIILL